MVKHMHQNDGIIFSFSGKQQAYNGICFTGVNPVAGWD
jgi:hypothetical protein